MENKNNNNIPKLIPLDKQCGPEFPLETLPPVLQNYVKEVSMSYQVPYDLPASLVLAACATAIGKQYNVQIKPDWIEPCNIFVGIAMPPASRKSPVFKAVMTPIEEAEHREWNKNKDLIKENNNKRSITEKKIKKATSEILKANNSDEEKEIYERIEQLENELPNKVQPLRLIADDVTPEKMTSLLAENNGRLSIMSAEGGIFDTIGGRYSNNAPNIDVLLKGHDGDMIRVDRMGRDSEIIYDPALTLGLTFQPSIIQNILKQPSFRGRGLLGRFLYVMPKNIIGYRNIDTPSINPGIKVAYLNFIRTLISDLLDFEKDNHKKPLSLHLSDEARHIFRQYEVTQERHLRLGGLLSDITDWGGKLSGRVARLMGILHVAKYGSESINYKIDKETVLNATKLGDYYTKHALIAFTLMGSDEKMYQAHKIISWMKENNKNSVSARDIHQVFRGSYKSMDDLWPILQLLQNNNYLTLITQQSNRSGRKPSPIYNLHPDLLTQNTHNTQNAV